MRIDVLFFYTGVLSPFFEKMATPQYRPFCTVINVNLSKTNTLYFNT
jgi:hypothetical protein